MWISADWWIVKSSRIRHGLLWQERPWMLTQVQRLLVIPIQSLTSQKPQLYLRTSHLPSNGLAPASHPSCGSVTPRRLPSSSYIGSLSGVPPNNHIAMYSLHRHSILPDLRLTSAKSACESTYTGWKGYNACPQPNFPIVDSPTWNCSLYNLYGDSTHHKSVLSDLVATRSYTWFHYGVELGWSY